jgi:hypothetical protein
MLPRLYKVPQHRSRKAPEITEEYLEKLGKQLKGMSEPQLREFITSLYPPEEMEAGKQLLLGILDIGKETDAPDIRVARVVDFVCKARMVVKEGKILGYDFKHDPNDPNDERDVLPHGKIAEKTSPIGSLSRRRFLGLGFDTVGHYGFGAYFYLEGLAGALAQIFPPKPGDPAFDEHHREPSEHLPTRAKEFLSHTCYPAAMMFLGIIFVRDADKHWEESKYEQISNAVTEFVKRAPRAMEKASHTMAKGEGAT